MASTLIICFLTLLGLCASTVIEQISEPPNGWKYLGPADPGLPLSLSIAISNVESEGPLERTVLEVSTPGNERYGHHLSFEQLKEKVQIPQAKLNAVQSWLQDSGLSSSQISVDMDWIDIRPNVTVAESLFSTKFGIFQESVTSTKIVRALAYSLPASIKEDINFVVPMVDFPTRRPTADQFNIHNERKLEDRSDLVGHCNISVVTPPCVREIYNISPSPNLNPSRYALGIYADALEHGVHKDIKKFLKEFAPYAKGQDFEFIPIKHGKNPQHILNPVAVEADIDLEWSIATGYPVTPLFYVPGHKPGTPPYMDGFHKFLRYLIRLPDDKLPHVISFSYPFYEYQGRPQYRRKLRTLCNLFARVAARGISTLAASGDTGVSSLCHNKDGFVVDFPATCPWVTAVGATKDPLSEKAVPLSTGGFSDIFKAPKYQKKAVDEYFNIIGNNTNRGKFDRSGRAIPDIAALGDNMAFVAGGRNRALGGTSYSAPIWAAVVALLNSERKAHGKARLGFLNPWIYSKAYAALNDITEGRTKSCNKGKYYWPAAKGWDAVTGFGTPDYQKLRQLALST